MVQLNTLHQSNWKVTFSNLPTINQSDMYLYDSFVKSITLPNYDLSTEKSNFKNIQIRQPVTKANYDLPELLITFRTTEDFQNYYNLMLWSMQIKYGQPDSSYEDLIRNKPEHKKEIQDNYLGYFDKEIDAHIEYKNKLLTLKNK